MSTDTPKTDEVAQCAEVVHQDSHTEEWVDASFARTLERELDETRRKLEEFIQSVERDHFRTVHDSGAHPNSLMIWNRVRIFAGMHELTRSDLPAPCNACGNYHRVGECAETKKGGAS